MLAEHKKLDLTFAMSLASSSSLSTSLTQLPKSFFSLFTWCLKISSFMLARKSDISLRFLMTGPLLTQKHCSGLASANILSASSKETVLFVVYCLPFHLISLFLTILRTLTHSCIFLTKCPDL